VFSPKQEKYLERDAHHFLELSVNWWSSKIKKMAQKLS